jgi:hypothetical protein
MPRFGRYGRVDPTKLAGCSSLFSYIYSLNNPFTTFDNHGLDEEDVKLKIHDCKEYPMVEKTIRDVYKRIKCEECDNCFPKKKQDSEKIINIFPILNFYCGDENFYKDVSGELGCSKWEKFIEITFGKCSYIQTLILEELKL